MIISKSENETYSALDEALNVLENAEYLSEDISLSNPISIPIFENTELTDDGSVLNVVQLSDIVKISEDYGVDVDESIAMIAEANEIEPESVAVAIKEELAYLDESIVNEFENNLVVLTPISEQSFAYKFVDSMVEAFVESADDFYLDFIINDDYYLTEAEGQLALPAPKKKSLFSKLDAKLSPGQKDYLGFAAKYTAALGAASAGAMAADKILKASNGKPKAWISKKIASLRSLYSKWVRKAKLAKNNRNANAFQKVANRIMDVIRALMDKLKSKF